jgi:transcriptional regulator with XRE-family HTH domain
MTESDTFAARFRQARKARGLSTTELAGLIQSSERQIRRYEQRENGARPKDDRLLTLANVLQVSPSWLLFGETEAA